MRVTLLLLLLSSTGLFGQTYSSNCAPAGDMVAVYKHDVFRIALARLKSLQSPYRDSVEIPASYRDSIAKGLYAIENMEWTPLKDTILNMFGFRNFNPSQQYERDSLHIITGLSGSGYVTTRFRTVYLYVNSSADFYQDWLNGNYRNTVNNQVNYLVQRYSLQVHQSANAGEFNITSPFSLNTFVLASKFAAMQGVQASPTSPAGQDNYGGDGNSIGASYDADGIILEYRNGCGDCPAGCTYTTTWTFKVFTNTDCHVQYVGRIPIADGETAYQRVCSRGIVLPLSFLTLNGTLKNNIPSLDWKKSSEENIVRYEIERSVDGARFTKAGEVPARATSANTKTYLWSDDKLLTGTTYYRIKSVSITGVIAYSSILKLSPDKKAPGLFIYPNPVINNSMAIQISNLQGNYRVSIYTMQGSKIYTKRIAVTSASFVTGIQMPAGLAKGSYQVVLQNEHQQFKQLVQVQ